MTELKLRVSGLYRPGEHVYPSGQMALIQLVGSWLERAGFPVGVRVRVDVVEDGLLVLSRVDEHEEELSAVATAWEPVEADSSSEPSETNALAEVSHA